jgi:zinc protease
MPPYGLWIQPVRISVTTLARNYGATLDLVEEILLQPRWDEKEFALVKASVLSQIRQQEADPNALASIHFAKLVYARDDPRSRNILGTAETVDAITIDDLKAYYRAIETAAAKLAMLDNMSKYGWRADYVKEREQIVKAMTLPRIQALSQKYLDPAKMVWLVVGDAKTQLPRMKALGFDEPVLIGQ